MGKNPFGTVDLAVLHSKKNRKESLLFRLSKDWLMHQLVRNVPRAIFFNTICHFERFFLGENVALDRFEVDEM